MNKKVKVLAFVLLASTLLLLSSNLGAKASTTAIVAVLSSVGGTTSPAGGTTPTETIGQSVTFTATPSTGWNFFFWIVTTAAGSTTYTTNPLSWNVTGEGSVQAMFLPATNATVTSAAAGTAAIDVLTSAGGSTTPAAGTKTYTIGQTVTFTATAGSVFKFLCWIVAPAKGGIVYTANPLVYNVSNSGCAAQALFLPTSSTVTLPKIVNEYSSAATVGLAIAMVAVACGTYAYKKTKK